MKDYISDFSIFTKSIYDTYMTDIPKKSSNISKLLYTILITYLNKLVIDKKELDKFKIKINNISKKLLKMNIKVKNEIIDKLPLRFHNRITDLNSAVMGVPNDTDSDIDITIAVYNSNEQQIIGNILKSLQYKLTHIYTDNKPAQIKWHSYHKYVDNIEIEIKVRSIRIVKRILIAHTNIKNDLTPKQKLKISFIKSKLLHYDKKTYKTFKYILYGAMFKGHSKSIIFRH